MGSKCRVRQKSQASGETLTVAGEPGTTLNAQHYDDYHTGCLHAARENLQSSFKFVT